MAAHLNTDYFARCIATLDEAVKELDKHERGTFMYDICRAASIKEFEIILEQAAKLLKKCLSSYFASHKQADQLTFKDVFRFAAKHGFLDEASTLRWLQYRDNRNETAHDYGIDFAEKTLSILPAFIVDAQALYQAISAFQVAQLAEKNNSATDAQNGDA